MDIPSLTVLSLCTGAGGLDLGLKLAVPDARVVCHVEIEAFACALLAARMREGTLDDAPIWTNLKTFDGRPWRGVVDCITAGYPCQPFSYAGKRQGDKDPRHLWPEVARIVREINPRICFFENVGGHLRLGFEQVHDDLSAMGYQVKAGLFTAEEVGASHSRERLFIVANNNGDGFENERREERGGLDSEGNDQDSDRAAGGNIIAACGFPADVGGSSEPAEGQALPDQETVLVFERTAECLSTWPPLPSDAAGWRSTAEDFKPLVYRMADGMADRVDRVRACGNGVVPLVAAYAWHTLKADKF